MAAYRHVSLPTLLSLCLCKNICRICVAAALPPPVRGLCNNSLHLNNVARFVVLVVADNTQISLALLHPRSLLPLLFCSCSSPFRLFLAFFKLLQKPKYLNNLRCRFPLTAAVAAKRALTAFCFRACCLTRTHIVCLTCSHRLALPWLCVASAYGIVWLSLQHSLPFSHCLASHSPSLFLFVSLLLQSFSIVKLSTFRFVCRPHFSC